MAGSGGARLRVLAFLAASALALGAAGVWTWRALAGEEAAIAMHEENAYRAPRGIPLHLPLPPLAGVRVAVLEAPGSEAFGGEGAHAAEVAAWRALLADAGAVLSGPAEADVLVLARAVCLGGEARARVASHLAAGRGVVSTGPSGARDGGCRTVREPLFATLAGGAAAPYTPPEEGTPYATVLGETALGAHLPPGARLEVRPGEQYVFPGADRAVFWSTYQGESAARRGRAFDDGAVTRARVGPGRAVVFGFSLAEAANPWSEAVARGIAANALGWAAGRPVAQLAPWPAGKRAAAVLAQDVEADFPNAIGAARLLERRGLPATWFVVGALAEQNPWTMRRLQRSGEVASHTHDHRPVDVLPDPGQSEALRHSMERAAALAGVPVVGLRPPEERFNLHTLRTWAALGGTYVFASNDARAAGPELVPVGADTLVLLARVVDDDFHVLARSSVRDRGVMTRTLLGQLDRVVAVRGLYMFSYHSHMFARRDLLPVVAALADELVASDTVWTATAREVADWWRARAAVRVEADPAGRHVTVTNDGAAPFRGGVLLADLPDGSVRRLALPDLAPGQARRVAL